VDAQLVSCLAPEATDDLDNIIIQRSWEDKLSYVVHVEGTTFPVGGVVPVNISLMPLEKISLYRVTLGIEGECKDSLNRPCSDNLFLEKGMCEQHRIV